MFKVSSLDPEDKPFMVYVMFIAFSNTNKVYPCRKAQVTLLKIDEVFTIFFLEYFDIADIFFPKLVTVLPTYTRINNQAINFVDSKQSSYKSINSLEWVDFKTFKTYIKIKPVNNFIRFCKLFVSTSIFVD